MFDSAETSNSMRRGLPIATIVRTDEPKMLQPQYGLRGRAGLFLNAFYIEQSTRGIAVSVSELIAPRSFSVTRQMLRDRAVNDSYQFCGNKYRPALTLDFLISGGAVTEAVFFESFVALIDWRRRIDQNDRPDYHVPQARWRDIVNTLRVSHRAAARQLIIDTAHKLGQMYMPEKNPGIPIPLVLHIEKAEHARGVARKYNTASGMFEWLSARDNHSTMQPIALLQLLKAVRGEPDYLSQETIETLCNYANTAKARKMSA